MQIWKAALILPVLKPGKTADKGSSYRPISLLCPAVKILERLLHPSLKEAFNLEDHQHGFHRRRSCTTALLPFTDKVANGFKQRKPPRRSVAVALYISRAFDTVDHTILLQNLAATPLHPNLLRWLATFLRGRTSSVSYHGYVSPPRRVHLGVPQGGVLSPDLYAFFVVDQPSLAELHEVYADDSHDAISAVNIDDAAGRLSTALSAFDNWASDKKLAIAPAKSTVNIYGSIKKF